MLSRCSDRKTDLQLRVEEFHEHTLRLGSQVYESQHGEQSLSAKIRHLEVPPKLHPDRPSEPTAGERWGTFQHHQSARNGENGLVKKGGGFGI